MPRLKPGCVRVRLLTGKDAYVNTLTMKEVTEAEALGNVSESSRTNLNESSREIHEPSDPHRLTDNFRKMGLSKKEARLDAGTENNNSGKSDKKRLRDNFRGLGLTKKEAKFAAKGPTGR